MIVNKERWYIGDALSFSRARNSNCFEKRSEAAAPVPKSWVWYRVGEQQISQAAKEWMELDTSGVK